MLVAGLLERDTQQYFRPVIQKQSFEAIDCTIFFVPRVIWSSPEHHRMYLFLCFFFQLCSNLYNGYYLCSNCAYRSLHKFHDTLDNAFPGRLTSDGLATKVIQPQSPGHPLVFNNAH